MVSGRVDVVSQKMLFFGDKCDFEAAAAARTKNNEAIVPGFKNRLFHQRGLKTSQVGFF